MGAELMDPAASVFRGCAEGLPLLLLPLPVPLDLLRPLLPPRPLRYDLLLELLAPVGPMLFSASA